MVTHRGNLRVLEVASVTAKGEDDPLTEKGPETKPKRIAALRTFTATIVFVIDSTISMGPYIERTKEAVRRVYDRVESEGLLDQVKFGLVAYRSSTEAVPGLEYVAQVYADPTKVKDGPDFLAKVAELKPATVSSARFDEDAYAGVMTAIQSVDWSEFGGRYLVLVTDAGALDPENELSSTGLGANEVRIEAEQLGIALYTMHLKTPNGRGNHGSAERQYKTLTRNAIVGRPLYYSVEGGDVETFGTIVDRLGADMVQQVRAASRGELAAGTARVADSDTPADPTEEPADLQEQISSDAALLGHAMQLAYLGRVQGARAPDLFQAWLTDRDFENPERATTEVRVLLTKNQLSDMRDVVRTILDTGEEAQDQVGTADFFDLLRSSAAHLARDPNQLNRQDATRLGELGLLGEYLDDLPYRSDVMNLTSDIWEEWGATEQEDFLDHLRRKIRHYQIYHDDGARWVALSPTADPGEHVYPVPIEALP